MTAPRPRLYNIPTDVAFLPALVAAIDSGNLPAVGGQPPRPEELARWTILVPNRRAARALGQAFLQGAPDTARLLPRIRPIGDIDEDLLDLPGQSLPGDDLLAPAISPAGREFLLLALVNAWAAENPQESLARDLEQSPAHGLGFAESLAQLLDRIETEGKDLLDLAALYDIDLALHRQALIGLLATIREEYPRRLAELKLMDPTARRNALIRHQARLLREIPPRFPVIAAGSTGSIPATAELLRTIAGLAQGAVILPGLDSDLDKASWDAITPQHPQYGLKRLLEFMGADRGEVETLSDIHATPQTAARRWFASEIMRPAETAASWREAVSTHRDKLALATDGMTFCPLRSRREEATAIAIILRQALDVPSRTAALITPDRELARRVAAELHRWNIVAYDSAGEALSNSLPGRLVQLLIDAILRGFDAVSLAALIHHPLAQFGTKADVAAIRYFELAVLRGGVRKGLDGLSRAAAAAREEANSGEHVHLAIKRLSSRDWDAVQDIAAALQRKLAPLDLSARAHGKAPFELHLSTLLGVLENVAAPSDLQSGNGGAKLADLFATMLHESHLHPPCRFAEAMLMVGRLLRTTSTYQSNPETPRISILGLLEARLLRSDIVVLGGLNEGKWPAQSNPGPWINRPMRDVLGMQMPERDIGLTAHDFVQALGAEHAYLTWSDRIEGAPAVPSRWVTTARMLLAAAKLDKGTEKGEIARWVHELDAPLVVKPVNKPKPMPPLDARPRRFSVTDVEKLIRDPYAIYAGKVLRLEPLPELVTLLRHALRGSLIHDSLQLYEKMRGARDISALETLLEAGKAVFADYGEDDEIMSFWWPRFARLAQWFTSEDERLRLGIATSLIEQRGKIDFPVGDIAFTLSARADRIDLYERGTARIIDYKTGTLPGLEAVETGFKPQLTLEAAILARDGFGLGRPVETEDLVYIKLSGGEPPGEIRALTSFNVMDTAEKHLAEFKKLLADYLRPQQGYLPILAMERERDRSDFDHLSRHDEWALAGEVKA